MQNWISFGATVLVIILSLGTVVAGVCCAIMKPSAWFHEGCRNDQSVFGTFFFGGWLFFWALQLAFHWDESSVIAGKDFYPYIRIYARALAVGAVLLFVAGGIRKVKAVFQKP